MIKQLILLFAFVFTVAVVGSVFAQTATTTPTPTKAATMSPTKVPQSPPNTGFGSIGR